MTTTSYFISFHFVQKLTVVIFLPRCYFSFYHLSSLIRIITKRYVRRTQKGYRNTEWYRTPVKNINPTPFRCSTFRKKSVVPLKIAARGHLVREREGVKRKSSLLRVSQYHLTSFFKSLFYSPRYNVIPNGRSWKFSIKRTKYSSARIIHGFTY